jgi:ankyrin repeat protein
MSSSSEDPGVVKDKKKRRSMIKFATNVENDKDMAKKDTSLLVPNVSLEQEFPEPVERYSYPTGHKPIATGQRKIGAVVRKPLPSFVDVYFNKETGSIGLSMDQVVVKPGQVLLILSTEENGAEDPIIKDDLITEILNLDGFDTNYRYNRRKVRTALVKELGLELAETGQRSGRRKCIRFRGDKRQEIRQWLISEKIAADAHPYIVDDDGFAGLDVKKAHNEHLKSANLPTVVMQEHPIVKKWLIAEAGGDVAKENKKLLKAVEEGHLIEVQTALRNGAEADCANRDGLPGLSILAKKRYLNTKTQMEEWEPLEKEFIDIAGVLLDAGADPNKCTQGGYTPLMHAAATNQMELLRLLLARGADPNLYTERGYTALMQATNEHRKEAMEDLLIYGAAVNATDTDGWTAMMRAAYRNQTALVELLLGYGANRIAFDESGWDAHALAKYKKHEKTEEALRVEYY